MRTHKLAFSSIPMKKWSGGMFIMVLAAVFIIRYSFTGIEPKNQSDHNISENLTANYSISEAKTVTESFEKPRIVDFEGLNYLFSQNNQISQDDSTALLVWSQMRPFLARSDALQETAQGIKEAALAWKDFLYLIQEEEELTSKSNDTEQIESGKCRFSAEASVGEPFLQLPCGLVLDSSITAVGIPSENSTNFRIELVGKAFSNRTNPPIVLHYNVSLPGDNMMHDPSIVQNTWTEELGWGNEVCCPNHGSANSRRVDELPVCNDQTVRSVLEETQNTSQPNGNVSINTSRGRTNFPFPEGNPFTATLWVGLEGFHMTVNGRHETSFAYRENLEPWSVSEVRVTGGLNILSMLATGLPVPEDHGLTADENLKAPSLPSKKLTLLIGVFSTGNNFARRMALRRSWMQYEAVRSGEVAVRFLIGLHKTAQVNSEMWRESKAYGDIQFMPFVDYYGLISLKTIALCILGTRITPAKYVMKTDDDAFVRIDELLSRLKEKPSNALLYGLITPDSSPNREENSKWYISEKEWPNDSYPPWRMDLVMSYPVILRSSL